MRRIFLAFILFAGMISFVYSQDRVNEPPFSLSYKSKEIRSAKYWSKNNGTWKSRSAKKIKYRSGVQDDNFQAIFIGKIDTLSFLFIDYLKGEWKYPNLKIDWTYYRRLHSALISDKDYERLKNIQQGDTVNIISFFNFKMYKNHSEYSFPFFVDLMKTDFSASDALYRSYKKTNGEDYAKRKYRQDNPPVYIFAAKRTMSNGSDVVRFCLFPAYLDFGTPSLIDSFYFEIPYQKYMLLFESDDNLTYK